MKKYLLLLVLPIFAFASIGKITALKGDVTIKRASETIHATIGTSLEKHDFISTSKAGKVQIVFNDKTIFTVGKNSTLDIAEYLYDESTPSNNKAQFRVLKGAFSSITGRIGKLNKSKFKLKTRSASIGIRGTIVKANQEMVMCTQGAITVTTNSGVSVDVDAGYKTIVKSGVPTKPTKITPKDIKAVKSTTVQKSNNNKVAEEVQATANEQNAVNNAKKDITLSVQSVDKNGNRSETTITGEQDLNHVTVETTNMTLVDDQGNPTNTVNTQGVSWGYWNDDPSSKWVAGETTKVQVLDDLRNSTNTVNATYNGQVMGTVNGTDDIKMDSSNQIQVNFELGGGKNNMDGNIKFQTNGGSNWNANFSGSTSGSNFSSSTVSDNKSGVVSDGSSVKGPFYGSEAQSVGGTFILKNADNDKATGVFKATK